MPKRLVCVEPWGSAIETFGAASSLRGSDVGTFGVALSPWRSAIETSGVALSPEPKLLNVSACGEVKDQEARCVTVTSAAGGAGMSSRQLGSNRDVFPAAATGTYSNGARDSASEAMLRRASRCREDIPAPPAASH
jgi:hypothetical protein